MEAIKSIQVSKRIDKIRAPLLVWYDANKREMPWRQSSQQLLPSPYHIWISEIMLQQTRVEAVRDYYTRFLEYCPDIWTLAAMSEDRLLKLWEGLGYYNRARNLKKAAILVCEKYDGKLPADDKALRQLPGIGEYTAGAIASIAFGIRVPAVDGNVCRVFARLLAIRDDISGINVKKAIWERVSEMIAEEPRPGDFNQSLMELGATVCLPNGAPHCGTCPLIDLCESKRLGCETQIPVKVVKKPRRVEARTICFIRSERGLLLFRRPDKGLLRGLYEPLNLEGWFSEEELNGQLARRGILVRSIRRLLDAKHIFTHVEWWMRAWEIQTDSLPEDDAIWALQPQDYAIAAAFRYWENQ